VSAGLGVYLYGTLAVLAIGAGGPPDDNLTTVSSIVDDRLGNNDIFYLALLPLVTLTFGWAAAAATARVCQLPDHTEATHLSNASYAATTASYSSATTSYESRPAIRGAIATWPRTVRVGLTSAAVAGIVGLGFVTGMRG
jgi:hypothetical protein